MPLLAPSGHTAPSAAPDPLHFWRMSVAKYHAAIAAGILTTEDKVELLQGVLVAKDHDDDPMLVQVWAPPASPSSLTLWRMSVEQYHAMIEHGILTTEDRVELLRGLLVSKMPIDPDHASATENLRDQVPPLLPAGWIMRSQQPIVLAIGMPEPDGAIARGRRPDYYRRHPRPSDLAMVAEVSESTLVRDRGMKLEMYAEAGIAVYWIVNLVDRVIEVYTLPVGAAYTKREDYGMADTVPLVLDGVEVGRIPVAQIIP